MALITTAQLKTLDYAFNASPACDLIGKSSVTGATGELDQAIYAAPYVTSNAGSAISVLQVPVINIFT